MPSGSPSSNLSVERSREVSLVAFSGVAGVTMGEASTLACEDMNRQVNNVSTRTWSDRGKSYAYIYNVYISFGLHLNTSFVFSPSTYM